MWDKIILAAIAIITAYIIVKNWDEIVHEVAKWARENNYQGVIKVLCQIEEVRAGVVQVTLRFLGKKGETREENPPIITQKEINYEELPPEFQYTGTREHEMTV